MDQPPIILTLVSRLESAIKRTTHLHLVATCFAAFRSAKVLIVSLSTFGLFRLVARNIMPPKTSQVEQSGFIAKQEDFPALSPVGASGSSGVLLQERTSRLESSQADLARSVAALHEGQQELAHQIGELIRGFSAPTSSSSRVSSVPPAAQVVTDQTQFTQQAAHLRQPIPAAPQRQLS